MMVLGTQAETSFYGQFVYKILEVTFSEKSLDNREPVIVRKTVLRILISKHKLLKLADVLEIKINPKRIKNIGFETVINRDNSRISHYFEF